jgi:O-antigen/teichoic acid export membrane protein
MSTTRSVGGVARGKKARTAGAKPASSTRETPREVESIGLEDRLRSPQVGLDVIRGGTVRAAGYGAGMVLSAVTSVFLLRYLGVADFGRYMTVASLAAIVGGVTDVGLSAISSRDLALRPPGSDQRRRLLANLLGLRLVLTPLGVLGATAFAILAHYDRVLVVGTLLAGIGIVLVSSQVTMTLPLTVDLRIGRVTTVELLKQAVMLVAVALLVALGVSLLPFFGVQVAVGLAALAVTPLIAGREVVWLPAFDRSEWKTLLREALPLAVALILGIVYFRILIVLMSLLSSPVKTGLFATSFRVIEILYGVGALAVTVALPVLAVAAEDRRRLRYMLQRMSEVAVMVACYLVLIVVIVAEPVLDLLGGSQYRGAAPVLRIQALALIPVFVGQAYQMALISIRRQSAQAVANGLALILVVALGLVLIPLDGARGGAVAALVAETALTALLLLVLVKADRTLRPTFGFLWKVACAGGAGASVLLVPVLSTGAKAVIATLLYAVILWSTRAIPREIVDAFSLPLSIRRSAPPE